MMRVYLSLHALRLYVACLVLRVVKVVTMMVATVVTTVATAGQQIDCSAGENVA